MPPPEDTFDFGYLRPECSQLHTKDHTYEHTCFPNGHSNLLPLRLKHGAPSCGRAFRTALEVTPLEESDRECDRSGDEGDAAKGYCGVETAAADRCGDVINEGHEGEFWMLHHLACPYESAIGGEKICGEERTGHEDRDGYCQDREGECPTSKAEAEKTRKIERNEDNWHNAERKHSPGAHNVQKPVSPGWMFKIAPSP